MSNSIITEPVGSTPTAPITTPDTWESLTRIEPGLAALERRIQSSQPASRQDFWRQWEDYKRQLAALVGWSARNPILSDPGVYERACRKLFDVAELRFFEYARGTKR